MNTFFAGFAAAWLLRLLIKLVEYLAIAAIPRIKSTDHTVPNYYRLVDGRQFVEFFNHECFPLLCDDLTHIEYSHFESAMEHYFRNGMKPGEKDDDSKYLFWINQAKSEFVLRHGYDAGWDKAISHAKSLVSLHRELKLDEMKLERIMQFATRRFDSAKK